MNVLEVIASRRTIRVFQKKVPSKKVIRECLESAAWAPSPTNQQPWEFLVVTGKMLEKLCEVIARTFPEKMAALDPYGNLPQPCEKRRKETFEKLFAAAKAAGLDPRQMFRKSLSFYGAPVVVLFLAYKKKDDLYRFSTVAALENFLLAAHAKGLGACWLSAASVCQEEIRKAFKIPEDKEIVDSAALGYPAKDSPLNTYPRDRLPAEKVTRWLGF
jgi:nitroreductase